MAVRNILQITGSHHDLLLSKPESIKATSSERLADGSSETGLSDFAWTCLQCGIAPDVAERIGRIFLDTATQLRAFGGEAGNA